MFVRYYLTRRVVTGKHLELITTAPAKVVKESADYTGPVDILHGSKTGGCIRVLNKLGICFVNEKTPTHLNLTSIEHKAAIA
ncbi:hypothetical protein J6590_024265 [Homalodisca vitripennis]|nr:hypothetical protein J6590_024265 [Homalodisca vitripennis]